MNPADFIPLREPTFYILLSLAPEEKHGYAILKDVETLSEGRILLSTSTLYEALARLLDQGLIERVKPGAGEDATGDFNATHPGKPRKAYRMTELGRAVLDAEVRRLRALVNVAQYRLGDVQG